MTGILISRFLSPYTNLSIGTYLTKQVGKTFPEKVLFLSSSHHGVFIGKHQNCWKECNMLKMKEDDIPLVRRDTGGGACYVDRGNRLFSFIEVNNNPTYDRYYSVLINALNNLDLKGQVATMQGRNDVTIDQKKVSGSAFTFNGKVFRHHGTLLHSVDKTALSTYLTPSKMKLQSKAIDSVAKRICNLIDINPSLTIDDFDHAIIEAYRRQNPSSHQVVEINANNIHQHITDKALYQEIFNKYTSHNFLYNLNPDFTHKFEQKLSFGIIELLLSCSNNTISECKVFSDSLDLRFIECIQNKLLFKDYSFEGVEKIRGELLVDLGDDYQEKIKEFCSSLRREFFE